MAIIGTFFAQTSTLDPIFPSSFGAHDFSNDSDLYRPDIWRASPNTAVQSSAFIH